MSNVDLFVYGVLLKDGHFTCIFAVVQYPIEGKLQQQVDNVRIDNTFYSQKNFANVDLRQVYDFMKKSDTFNVEYHIELFAGMYFHPKKERYPTILFFRTGSYTMMGRTEENIL